MKKLSLFLAGLLLGMFFGRVYHLMRAPTPWPPPTAVHLPDNDEETTPCEYITKLQPLYP